MSNSEIIIYQNPDGNIKIDVRLEEETVWLTQAQMASLFGKGRSTVAEHIANVFEEGELEQNRTCRKFRQVQKEGNREIAREIDHYWNSLTADGGQEGNCGWLKDKFGVSWQIVPTVLPRLLSDPTRAQRVIHVYMGMKKFDIQALENA